MEITSRLRAALRRGADFTPSFRPSRPFITKKDALKIAVPLSILTVTAVSCGPQGQEGITPVPTEMPKSINAQIAEQMAADQPFAGYNTGESRKSEPYIQELTPTYGEFKGSTALIGIATDNSKVMSEILAFDKGIFVVFYDEEGKAVSELAPVSVNYGYDNKNNLSMIFNASLEDGESGTVKSPFLILTSETTLDNIDPDVLKKATEGDAGALQSFIQFFDQPDELTALSFSNPKTNKNVSMESQTTPSWTKKILKALQAVNPLSVSVAHAAPPNTQTPESATAVPPPAINESVKTTIGEKESKELVASMDAEGKMSGTDYVTGKKFDATVNMETISTNKTADINFPNIITAEAKDSSGKIFNVVWNPETNSWIKVTKVNTNLSAYTKNITFQDVSNEDLLNYVNYTHFKNIDKMIESGDFNLVLLAQGIGSEAFPANTEAAQYGLGVNTSVTGGPLDYFAYLNLMRADYAIPEDRKDNLNYTDFGNGAFTKGSEAYQTVVGFEGTTSDNKSIIGLATVFQNTDKTNFTTPLGFDPRQFLSLFTANESKDAFGNDGMKRLIMEQAFKFVPIIPTDNPIDWDNASKVDWGDGGNHLVSFAGQSFKNDVIIPMQTPGEGFKFVPADLQQAIRNNISELRDGGYGPGESYLFPEGKVPLELAKFLSRNLNDVAAAAGSLNP